MKKQTKLVILCWITFACVFSLTAFCHPLQYKNRLADLNEDYAVLNFNEVEDIRRQATEELQQEAVKVFNP